MSYKDVRLNQLLRIYIDGIPLDLASSLQPFRTRFNCLCCPTSICMPEVKNAYAEKKVTTQQIRLSRLSLLGLIDNLESTINNLNWQPQGTEWADYYQETNYSREALEQ